jgi:hypothetical protein
VYFEREAYTYFVKDVEDRMPTCGEISETGVNLLVRNWGKRIEHLPNGAACESVDDRDAEVRGCSGGELHLLGRALPDSFRVAVSPDVPGDNCRMPSVDEVANGLTD